jgi:peptide/nickel transport system substrate-binding protein
VSTHSLPSFTIEQVYVNPNVGLLRDPAARRAFQQALDVDQLAQQVFAGRSDKATGAYPESMVPDGTAVQAIQPDAAPLQSIAAAASPQDKSIVLGYDTSQPDGQQLANLVAAKLQGLGLTPVVQGYPTSQVFGWVGNQQGAPNVYFGSFWPDAGHPYTAAHILYAQDGGLNYLGCSDPAVTKLLPGALETGDVATFGKIGELATATGCWANIAYLKDFMVTQTWLKGVEESHDIAAPMSLRIAGLSA